MKTTLLLLLIALPVLSQTKHTENDFVLENGKMYWEHVYHAPGQKSDDLIKHFQKEVLTNYKQDNLQILDNIISFEIRNDIVNFRKYGGTMMGTAIFAQMEINYLVVIDFKDEKYKVIIKDIFLDNKAFGLVHSSGKLEEYTAKKSVSVFQTNNIVTTGLNYQHQHFIEKFDIASAPTIKKDW